MNYLSVLFDDEKYFVSSFSALTSNAKNSRCEFDIVREWGMTYYLHTPFPSVSLTDQALGSSSSVTAMALTVSGSLRMIFRYRGFLSVCVAAFWILQLKPPVPE
jgi:hypothetical protein